MNIHPWYEYALIKVLFPSSSNSSEANISYCVSSGFKLSSFLLVSICILQNTHHIYAHKNTPCNVEGDRKTVAIGYDTELHELCYYKPMLY